MHIEEIYIKEARVTRWRSILKAVSWRVVGSLDTFLLTYLITGELMYGAFVAGTETVTKIVLYYFHERIWEHVRWGQKKA